MLRPISSRQLTRIKQIEYNKKIKKIDRYHVEYVFKDYFSDYVYSWYLLDGNSDIGAHLRSSLCYLICKPQKRSFLMARPLSYHIL